MRLLLAILISCWATSCSQLKYAATAKDGNKEDFTLTTFGGSQSLESAGGTRYTSNHVKTAGQFFQTVAAVAGAIGNSVNVGHTEHTAQLKDTNAAGVAKNASNNDLAKHVSDNGLAEKTFVPPTTH